MIYQTITALAMLASSSAVLYTSDTAQQKHMWETYKSEYNQNYPTIEEETKRLGHFLRNLKLADLRNDKERKNGGTATHGITKFAHLSQTEFAQTYLKADVSKKTPISERENVVSYVAPPTATATVPMVDWTGVYTTPVKDQGYCGGCWAFSAAEQIESDGMRLLKTNYILSPEMLIQCDKTSEGCNGGWTEHAYDFVRTAGGLATESSYPYTSYTGATGTCHLPVPFVVKVTGYTTIVAGASTTAEQNMAAYVQTTGPLSVCLDASSWSTYTGGILSVCGSSVDHCVQAVGINTGASTPYWKVRNQWGTSWGEAGYIQLLYGANTCDITNDPTHVTVTKMA